MNTVSKTDRVVLAGIAAGIIAAGLIPSTLSIGAPFSVAQANHQGSYKKVTLIADEMVVQDERRNGSY